MGDMIRVATTGTGTGNLDIASTVAGYLALSSAMSTGDTFYYTIFDVDGNGNPVTGGNVETGIGTYSTVSTTHIVRERVIRSSNSNALVSFGAGTKHIICGALAAAITPNYVNEFRLSLVTATPVPTTDQTGKSTLYCTPFTGNCLSLYTGKGLQRVRSTEFSVALSGLTSGKNYDVVAYFNASNVLKLDLMPAWTSDSARANAISVVQGGVWVNTSSFTSVINGDTVAALSGTYLGTIRTTGTTTTEDSLANRLVWNQYNRRQRPIKKTVADASYAYTTSTWRNVNADATYRATWVNGVAEDPVQLLFKHRVTAAAAASNTATIGLGIDTSGSTAADPNTEIAGTDSVAYWSVVHIAYFGILAAGYHFAQAQEVGATGTNMYTNANYGCGVFGTIWG